jgi:hypothetical protein
MEQTAIARWNQTRPADATDRNQFRTSGNNVTVSRNHKQNKDINMQTTEPKTTRQTLVDESEAATGATVTTSTVKHDVTAKITVDEDESDEQNGNGDDSPQDAEVNEKLKAIFAEASPVPAAAIAVEPDVDHPVTENTTHAGLTDEQKKMLNECETQITKGISKFVAVGNALSIIRLNKLFSPEYNTWEAYLEGRWEFTRQRAFQYMQAAEGYQKLSTQIAGQRKLPTSERGMRELMKAPSEKVVDILNKLGDEEELTAERIIKVREEVMPKKTPAKVKKKPAIQIENALKAAGVWAAYLAACDLAALTDPQREALKEANKTAVEQFSKLSIAA